MKKTKNPEPVLISVGLLLLTLICFLLFLIAVIIAVRVLVGIA